MGSVNQDSKNINESTSPESAIPNTADDKNGELLAIVDKKIVEAKLWASEVRLGVVLGLGGLLVALFGVVLPLYQSSQSEARVKDKISEIDTKFNQLTTLYERKFGDSRNQMESRYNEVIGASKRSPDLQCMFNGQPIDGRVIPTAIGEEFTIVIVNNGDLPAREISYQLYTNLPMAINGVTNESSWELTNYSDESSFSGYYTKFQPYEILHPNQATAFKIRIYQPENNDSLECKPYPAVLKIFYGQKPSKRYLFTLNLQRKKG